MTAIAHLRFVRSGPLSRGRGELATARGTRVYMTQPGRDEVELRGLTGWQMEETIDSATTVRLTMYATVEVEYEDEA